MVRIPVLRGKVLDFETYRGYAALSFLARISRPDIYDQQRNTTGTQRELKERHAAEAYDFARGQDAGKKDAFFPEIVLNVRQWDEDNISWEPVEAGRFDTGEELGYLRVNAEFYASQPEGVVLISRVDGNHRLHYAGTGKSPDGPVNRPAAFCLLNIEEWNPIELKVFRDVNATPEKMNATHLQQAEVRVLSDRELSQEEPALWLANQLVQDSGSPLHNKVATGSGPKGPYLLKLNQLTAFVEQFRAYSNLLHLVPDLANQYKILREFWRSVEKAFHFVFANPGDYIVLKSPGLYALGIVCATIVDYGLPNGKITSTGDLTDLGLFDSKLMIAATSFKWASGQAGDFYGLQGQSGGKAIAERVDQRLFPVTGPT